MSERTPCPNCQALVDAPPWTPQARQTIPCASCGGAITRLNRDDWIFRPRVQFAYKAPDPKVVLAARARPDLLTDQEMWLLDCLFDEDGEFLRDRREEANERLGMPFHKRRQFMIQALEKVNGPLA